ncbi:MAG: agmatine deiminase family protein [Gracilimonas sp.]|nr:agmatine deiminase family protein [Gracilimonas sp.]
MRLRNNEPLEVETLELPESGPENIGNSDSKNRCLSYAGFYIANGAVLVPQFNLSRDAEASNLIKRAFPGRKIIPIDSTALGYKGGSIHGITQQWQGITY